MPKAFQKWTVLPHGVLHPVGKNILSVTGELNFGSSTIQRRMTIVRLADKQLIIYSPIALDEKQMKQIEDFGKLKYMIIPSAHHRMDAKIWKDRFPQLKVIAPEGAKLEIDEVVRVDATNVHFNDPKVEFILVAGLENQEAALLVDQKILILNDLISTMPGTIENGPHIPKPVRSMIKDSEELRAQLLEWADLALDEIIVSHGTPITEKPAASLSRIASSML